MPHKNKKTPAINYKGNYRTLDQQNQSAMNLNIRERYQKVLQCWQEATCLSLRAIAQSTGISKSSVHRHLRTKSRQQQYPETYLWETEAGEKWLRLLVFGVIYCFGIKGGIGVGSLSAFFHLLHLEQHIGCSPSAIAKLETQIKIKIIAYEQEQSKGYQSEKAIGICVGADETFFGLPILVAVELASGFIFSEAICENRTYDTWWHQVSSWFNPEQWKCHYMVSDGAKALIKLALSGLNCPNVPDVFHLMRDLSKSMGAAISLQQSRLHKEQVALMAQLSPESKAQLKEVQAESLKIEAAHQDYQKSLHALSQSIHPFHLDTGESLFEMELQAHLQPHLSILERLSKSYAPTKSQVALERWKRQLPDLSGILHAWWQWVLQALRSQTQDPEVQNWVLDSLLPWVYLPQQTQKTRQPQLKLGYEQATNSSHQRFLTHHCTKTLPIAEQQRWLDWAIWICAKFQRTSSAVEGRNGYLSALHHSNRGFTPQTLKVLTIIHNFDIKRADGSTAAQRLFLHPFPDLFEWLVPRLGQLPRPRRTIKTPKSKKPILQGVPP